MRSLGINLGANWNSRITLQGLDPATLDRWPSTKISWIRLSSEHTGIRMSGGNALEELSLTTVLDKPPFSNSPRAPLFKHITYLASNST